MKREAIVPAGMRAFYDELGYAPAVRHGSTIYVSGQLGRDAQLRVVVDKEAQFVQVFENIATVLTAAGATFDDVVDVVSYHTDLRDLPLYLAVRDRYLGNVLVKPTWTAIGVSALGGEPGYLLQVQVIADTAR
jgi:enamine deaminase RidA (YjgF/YER057c/UK114 family)